jgi:hypothetical protein
MSPTFIFPDVMIHDVLFASLREMVAVAFSVEDWSQPTYTPDASWRKPSSVKRRPVPISNAISQKPISAAAQK